MSKIYNFFAMAIFIIVISSKYFILVSGENPNKNWKGFAIIGNGNMCAVYSDDKRISAVTKNQGIQHFYFNDYTCDYIASTSFQLLGSNGKVIQNLEEAIILDDFFAAHTKLSNNENDFSIRCFAYKDNAIVLSITNNDKNTSGKIKFTLVLRKNIITDRITNLNKLSVDKNGAVANYSNGNNITITPRNSNQNISITDSIVSIILESNGTQDIIISAFDKKNYNRNSIDNIKADKNLYKTSSKYWSKWINKGNVPKFSNVSDQAKEKYLDYYKRNLYCLKSANINGQIPADITGQFVTNNMPQLYPRDPMMCARVFLKTGHYQEAKEVIKFWQKSTIPMKSKGEWYARYDAYAKAIDGGTGARFDEPEWDANGYFIQLVFEYFNLTHKWITDKDFIYSIADLLVNKIDSSGLLYEGGIVEWTGYLPATNMTCSAALKTASIIAGIFGDNKKKGIYYRSSVLISKNLYKMFDPTIQSYADFRFIGKKIKNNVSYSGIGKDTIFLWDSSVNFGILWGYPNHAEIVKTNKFISENTVKLNGGVQYFDSPDAGLANYGNDVFFFTTSAAAQYHSLYGDKQVAKKHIDWMINNSNIYGLMPERIYLNESDCSPASPLSWCSAEFALALLLYSNQLDK